MDKDLPWAWEEVHGPGNMQNILQAIRDGSLYAVLDSSYFDRIGTSASIIDDDMGNLIWCLPRTPRAHRYQNLYCSELAGIVASLSIIKVVCDTYNVSFEKATICLDGEEVINNLKCEHITADCADLI